MEICLGRAWRRGKGMTEGNWSVRASSRTQGLWVPRLVRPRLVKVGMPTLSRLEWSQNCREAAGRQPFQGPRDSGRSCLPATLLQRRGQLLSSFTSQASYPGGIEPDPPTDPQRQNPEGPQRQRERELPPGIVCCFMARSQGIYVGGFPRLPHPQPLYSWAF